MNFVKMHGAGNDFLLVNAFEAMVDGPAEVSRAVCQRRFGVGADGLILMAPSEHADVRMIMFNPDGSRAEMCGNGLRLLAKLAREEGIVTRDDMVVETDAGPLPVTLVREGDRITGARVLMGVPLPLAKPEQPITVHDRTFALTAIDMGNPHAVVFLDEDLEAFPVETYGPAIETAPRFPDRTNVEFAFVEDERRLHQRTWERGAGETLACGTGASAVAAAAILTGRARSPLTIGLRGGDLSLAWDGEGTEIRLTGPAVEVYRGVLDV